MQSSVLKNSVYPESFNVMENRFAGAQNQGERRRRRLSSDDAVTEFMDEQQPPELPDHATFAAPIQDSILRRCISPKLWKSVLAILFVTVASAGLIYSASEQSPLSFRSHDEDISGRFAGLLLIAAAQFAIMIGWVRSLSEVDFKGRYRCWKWMGLALGASGVVLVLGVGGVLPGLLTSLLEPMTGEIQAARPAILLAAGATIFVVVLARVLPDMSRCLWSQTLLVGAVLLTVVSIMLQHGAHSNVGPETFKTLRLLSANAVFASMLLHCRFVAFICNDPPVISTAEQTTTVLDEEMEQTTEVQTPLPESGEAKSETPRKRKSKSVNRRAA